VIKDRGAFRFQQNEDCQYLTSLSSKDNEHENFDRSTKIQTKHSGILKAVVMFY
jgi:hypothetical protein